MGTYLNIFLDEGEGAIIWKGHLFEEMLEILQKFSFLEKTLIHKFFLIVGVLFEGVIIKKLFLDEELIQGEDFFFLIRFRGQLFERVFLWRNTLNFEKIQWTFLKINYNNIFFSYGVCLFQGSHLFKYYFLARGTYSRCLLN